MAQNIKILKLLNGEEIIGEVLDNGSSLGGDNTKIRISNPIRIVVMPSRNDPKTPTVGFAPWLEFTDEKNFTIDRAHVIVVMNPIKEFINQYNSITGGLVVPTNKIIVP